jgi:predicted ABC-type transport system involved in lysophospholipase L1 biosynthesis ATPase subunit
MGPGATGALMNSLQLQLAHEVTGNRDEHTAEALIDLRQSLSA